MNQSFVPPEPTVEGCHVFVKGITFHFICTQNGGHEILSTSPQEVEQVAVAAVLRDHQHGTWQHRPGNSDSGPTSVSLPVKKSYANHCLHLLECMRPEDSQCCHGTQGDLESSTPTSELHVPQRELSLFTQWDTDNQEHTEFHCSTIIYEMDWRLWTDVSASWLQHEWHHQSRDHMLSPLQPSQRPQNPKPHLS